ncbi:lipoprotein [Spiroplasma chrysopicola]|uniref:Lipoprotein n=1 Tax=Spiroplasma chrysopicola DF-1 TaxID=1276227 RepID=R4U3V6_9MOLU|nr:lipoprotein [Spiroplasma chrysopicola]AGM25188.1 hypothetical protein SCHRY_v1c06100 [Spiroplasma chrysopicola DF-1]
MKKILTLLTATTFMTTTATTVVACSQNNMKYYTEFMTKVSKEDTFVMFVSANDCPYCTVTKATTIKELYNNGQGTQVFKDYLAGNYGNQYALDKYYDSKNDQKVIDDLTNSYLYIADAKEHSGIWDQKGFNKIADWVVTQERNNNLINGQIDKTITVQSLFGSNATPFFLYIKQGHYMGFEFDSFGTWEEGSEPEKYFDKFIDHMVLENWKN